VAGRGRSGAADHPGSIGTSGALERLRHAACAGCPGACTYTYLLHAGRRRVRFGTQPHLLPTATPGQECAPGQAPLHLHGIECTLRDAEELSHRTIWKTLPDRNRLFRREKQTLLPCAGQNDPHPVPSGAPAGLGLQPVSPQTACSLTAEIKDVNRANIALVCFGGLLWRVSRGSTQNKHPVGVAVVIRARRRELPGSAVREPPAWDDGVGSVGGIEPLDAGRRL